jgi:hypothetical protein
VNVCVYIDGAQVEDYIAQGWQVSYIKQYFSKGHNRAMFLAVYEYDQCIFGKAGNCEGCYNMECTERSQRGGPPSR